MGQRSERGPCSPLLERGTCPQDREAGTSNSNPMIRLIIANDLGNEGLS